MTFTPDDLKSAAAAERAEIESRVKGKQSGIATYFDVFLSRFLDRLAASASEHGWNTNPRVSPRLNLFRRRRRTAVARDVAELRWLAAYLQGRKQGRLVPYEVRRCHGGDQSDIRSPERMMSQGKAQCLSWKGSPLFKSVYDFAILPMLLWELKPATVFEIGSGTGASARWMADIVAGYGLDTQIYSADLKPIATPYRGVHFLAGDCMSPASLFGDDLIRSAPHPFLIIEDAHINVREVLLYIDGFLTDGDYLFVEDSLTKHDALAVFLSERPDQYLVDTFYTDFFGRNATSAIDSILLRI